MNSDDVKRGKEIVESGQYRVNGAAVADLIDGEHQDDHHHDLHDHGGDGDPGGEAEPTTWEPIDLAPYLSGEIKQPEPTIGAYRSDGQRFIYPGREHAIVGELEAGKTWLALACVAAELHAGNRVLYLHYEEADATSTVERLRLLGVAPDLMLELLRFVAPTRPVRGRWLTDLLTPAPVLVIHDGVNEAMSLHGDDIMSADGAATFRRTLIVPCLRAGAATVACDHLPRANEGRAKDAYGSVHKGNAIDGARFVIEKSQPFGRGLRGVSQVFVTKDRPGQLRRHGKPSQVPGKTFFGTIVVDDSPTAGADFFALYAPKNDDTTAPAATDPNTDLADAVVTVITGSDGGAVRSQNTLRALLRDAGHEFTDKAVREVCELLVIQNRLTEIPGKRGATGYQIPATVADAENRTTVADDCCGTVASLRDATVRHSQQSPLRTVAATVRNSPQQSEKSEKATVEAEPQLTGGKATIVLHSSVFGITRKPARKFHVGAPRPRAQYDSTVSIDVIAPKKRTSERYTAYPDDRYFFTVEVDGATAYDSRTDVPCDMDKWQATYAEHGRIHDEKKAAEAGGDQ